MNYWWPVKRVTADTAERSIVAEGKAKAKIDEENRCVIVDRSTTDGADIIVIPFDNCLFIKLERVEE